MIKTVGRVLTTVALLMTFLLPNVVLAQTDEDQAQSSPGSAGQTGDSQTVDVQDDVSAPDFQAKLQERIQQKKAAIKTSFSRAQQSRIKARCKAAQGKITTVSAKAKALKTTRISVYQKISEKLAELSSKLKEAGVDTTEMNGQITELNNQIATFQTQLNNTHQAAVDASSIDCVADPSGFKAALESLRADREALAKTSAGIKTYITDTIRPTLVSQKQYFDAKAKTNDGGENQ